MDANERMESLVLWERCRPHMQHAVKAGTEAWIALADSLLPEWCIDGEAMQDVLAQGVQQGVLPSDTLGVWLAHVRDRQSALTPDCAVLSQAVDAVPVETPPPSARGDCFDGLGSDVHEPLPAMLRPVARAIGEFSRKKGHIALQMGRKLCEARRICRRTGCRFADFLEHLRRCYGLNRGTCYLYMKYADWNLPDGLGSAVMKWIVQGFQRGSPKAASVIEAAVQHNLTLAELSARFDRWRESSADETLDGLPSAKQLPSLISRLESDRQRLLKQRQGLDQRICRVEERLRLLQEATGGLSSNGCASEDPPLAAPDTQRSTGRSRARGV